MIGAQIITAISNFNEDLLRSHIIEAFSKYSNDDLILFALDNAGSRAIDGYLLSTKISKLHKYRFIKHIEPNIIKLALSTVGSYTLEKCFHMGDLNTKYNIAETLANNMSKMLGNRSGKILLRKFYIEEFRRDSNQWLAKIKSQHRVESIEKRAQSFLYNKKKEEKNENLINYFFNQVKLNP